MAITLSTEDFEQIIENSGIERYQTGYSGRNMYGEKCIAIIGDAAELVRFIQATSDYVNDAVEQHLEDGWLGGEPRYRALKALSHKLSQVKSDEMGLNTVYYWPGVQTEGVETEIHA